MSKSHNYYIYIMASVSNVLYIGITNDLIRRVDEHKDEINGGFSRKYKTHKLVYYEWFTDVNYAILREKEIKKWRREKKVGLIEKENSRWDDLYKNLIGE